MASTLTLEFVSSPEVVVGDNLIVVVNTGGGLEAVYTLVFKEIRTRNTEVAIPGVYSGNNIAISFTTSWNMDYRISGNPDILVATVNNNIVTITLNEPSWQFTSSTGTAITSGAIVSTINNDAVEVEKTVTIDDYTTSVGNECSQTVVSLIVTGGTESYNVYVDNVLSVSSQSSPVSVTIDRGIAKSLRVTDSNGVFIGTVQTINTRSLIAEDINIGLTNLSSGTTVTVTNTFISNEISSYEYSLNGTTYQTSNVFTGQSTGTYTMYVRDGLGCVTTKQYTIDGATTITDTIFEISSINPFRFAKVDSEKKNQLNTLSFNQLRLLPYAYKQMFLSTDSVTTQFKTNAQYIRVYKVDSNLNETDLTVLKKTNNVGLQAKSTCTYFDLENGRSGIYFGVVNSLDVITEQVIEQVNYGNALPQWANTEGNYVTISDIGQVQIDRISYSDTYNAFILEFAIAFTGSTERIISAQYNLQPYEIYEATTAIDLSRMNVVIEVGTSSESIDFCYISECIIQVQDDDFLFDIQYWDDENIGRFNYQTGLVNRLRLKGYQGDIGEQETEGYNGNKEYYVTDNVIYDVQKFTFNRLSTEMANKLRLVMAHKYLKINGLFYKLAEAPEVSGNDNSNMKNFVVTLKQGGDQVLTDQQEVIIDSTEQLQIESALASAKGKGLLLWTKNS